MRRVFVRRSPRALLHFPRRGAPEFVGSASRKAGRIVTSCARQSVVGAWSAVWSPRRTKARSWSGRSLVSQHKHLLFMVHGVLREQTVRPAGTGPTIARPPPTSICLPAVFGRRPLYNRCRHLLKTGGARPVPAWPSLPAAKGLPAGLPGRRAQSSDEAASQCSKPGQAGCSTLGSQPPLRPARPPVSPAGSQAPA